MTVSIEAPVYLNAAEILNMFSGYRSEKPNENIERFLSIVSMGISKDAQLNPGQANFVEAMISRVICGDLNKMIKDYSSMLQFAMQTVIFINTAHTANFAKK